MWKLLFAGGAASAGLDHIMSFNSDCTASFNVLAGTPAASAMNGNLLPFQAVHSFRRVLQARVAEEPGCKAALGTPETTFPRKSLYETLFGLDVVNVLRFLDSSETVLAAAAVPTGCDTAGNLMHWKKIKSDVFSGGGIALPSTCRADTYHDNGCKVKWTLTSTMNAEISVQDKCNDVAQAGWRMPQIELRCSGTACGSFARPCRTSADCDGLTCDFIEDAWLNNINSTLTELGLLNLATDAVGCDIGGFTFSERFASQIINAAADMFGLTNGISTNSYKQVGLCGISDFTNKYSSAPTPQPTPAPAAFYCNDPNNNKISLASVCDGKNDCPGAEDENLGCDTVNCGAGKYLDYTMSPPTCCDICGPVSATCTFYVGSNGWHCYDTYPQSGSNGHGPEVCKSDNVTNIVTCPDLQPSTYVAPAVKYPSLKSVNPTGNIHQIGWADCDGNFQLGNKGDLAVINAHVPFQEAAKRLESVLSSTESCRAKSDAAVMAKQFYPWGLELFGGLFFTTLSGGTAFGGVTPAAKMDDSMRYYGLARAEYYNDTDFSWHYNYSAPFKNVANPWSTCSDATVLKSATNTVPRCQVSAQIARWFEGTGFPATWSKNPASLQVDVQGNCPTSALPSASLVCNGACTSTSSSGCCIMSKPFIVTKDACPTGYTRTTIEGDATQMFFNNPTQYSFDTYLMNFLQLVSTGARDFGTNPTFIGVGAGELHSICLINGSKFDENTDYWANHSVTDHCPLNWSPATDNKIEGCPQIIANGYITACEAALKCPTTVPIGTTCPASGCPTSGGCAQNANCQGNANYAAAIVPAFAVMGALFLSL